MTDQQFPEKYDSGSGPKLDVQDIFVTIQREREHHHGYD